MGIKTVMAFCSVMAACAFARGAIPTAYIEDYPERTIVDVDGNRVNLDTACVLKAWPDGKPSYQEVAAYKRRMAEWLGWDVDFVVSFDRDVAARSVTLYGEVDKSTDAGKIIRGWNPVEIPAMTENQGIRLLEVLKREWKTDFGVKYGTGNILAMKFSFIDVMDVFNCAIKNLSDDNYATTVGVDVCLFNPTNSSECVSIGRFAYRISDGDGVPSWFDARIRRYRVWPADASKAYRGGWEACGGLPIQEYTEVTEPGELTVDGDPSGEYPMFKAVDPKSFDDGNITALSMQADLTLPRSRVQVPEVEPGEKCGLAVIVGEDGTPRYHGIAMVEGRNELVPLDSEDPVVGEDEVAKVTMELTRVGGWDYARYFVNGKALTYRGSDFIRVVVDGKIGGMKLKGETTVKRLQAEIVARRRGMVMTFR